MDNDLMQLWRLVSELSDQLAQNRTITASLQAQAGSVRTAASHQGTGFPLRRFNMHLPQEAFDAELERTNSAIVAQNTELQKDNKELAGLLKEYEQTLETVMSKFRKHAHEAQQHELNLTREYETLLLSRETSVLAADLTASTAQTHALTRISHLLRCALRAASGEPPPPEASAEADPSDDVDDSPLERECELARLENENRALRRMLGVEIPPDEDDAALLPPPPPNPAHAQLQLPEPPLVTRKYGRRSGSGSGSFIAGGGPFAGGSGTGGGTSVFFQAMADAPFGALRSGTWHDAASEEQQSQQRDVDERVAMYLRAGIGPHPPNL